MRDGEEEGERGIVHVTIVNRNYDVKALVVPLYPRQAAVTHTSQGSQHG